MTSVSVIIPCHNCEAWVGRAINSVLWQTYTVKEILLIENNSQDNTLDVLRQFEKEYPGIIRLYSRPLKGACAARNFGLYKATGEWIQFLDADDELLPDKIEEQVKIIKSQVPDVIVSDYFRVSQDEDAVYKIKIISSNDPWIGLIHSTLGITSANLWRKASLLKVNGLDESLASSQEYEMMFRLLQAKSKIIISHRSLTYIYKQSESISVTGDPNKKTKILLARYKLRLKILHYLQQDASFPDTYQQEAFQMLYTLLMSIREVNLHVFKAELMRIDFADLSFRRKLQAYHKFVCNSSKIRFRRKNIFLRLTERYFYMLTHVRLLQY